MIAAVALAVWGMHLGRGGISISSHMIIYHHMPRSNWTNNLHEDLGSGSHFQPRGVNKAKKLVQVLWCWGRDQKKEKKKGTLHACHQLWVQSLAPRLGEADTGHRASRAFILSVKPLQGVDEDTRIQIYRVFPRSRFLLTAEAQLFMQVWHCSP